MNKLSLLLCAALLMAGTHLLAQTETAPAPAAAGQDTLASVQSEDHAESKPPFAAIDGRISLQYYGMVYDNASYNIAQPGLVFNLRGKFRNSALGFETYGAIRRMSYGKASPFGSASLDQTRIYRMSLEFDDSVNTASVGRILPTIAPSIGYTDGVSIARRLGRFTIGTMVGFQPNFSQQGVNTDFRKFTLFANYQLAAMNAGSITTAYTRTYRLAELDREVVSLGSNLYTDGGFSFFANADVDLRSKSQGAYVLAPLLSTLFGTATYRFSSFITLGAGVMSVRPFTTWSIMRSIPDEFLDMRLRTNLLLTASFYLPVGVSLYSNYTPRVSDGPFGKEYSTFNTLTIANIFWSGVMLRGTFGINGSSYANVHHYGVGLQRSVFGVLDVTVRYDRQQQRVASSSLEFVNNSISTDLLVMISRDWFISLSHSYVNAYMMKYNSLYTEVSCRF